MNAVDAAESPEIEQDNLALQVGDFERPGGVEPGDAAVEFRRFQLRPVVEFRGGDGRQRAPLPMPEKPAGQGNAAGQHEHETGSGETGRGHAATPHMPGGTPEVSYGCPPNLDTRTVSPIRCRM